MKKALLIWTLLLVASLAVFMIAPASGAAESFAGAAMPLPFVGLMIINQASLAAMYKSFNTIFNETFTGTPAQWQKLAMLVPSGTKEEIYAWLGAFSKMREWVGDRVIKNLAASNYSIVNKDWEDTIAVEANDIKDDRIGLYSPLLAEMGRGAAVQPDELIWPLLAAGFATNCYDGQYYFDTDHPVGAGTKSNYSAGAGTPWYLLDLSRAVKPLIFQEREKVSFVALDSPTDANVFFKNKYVYGSYRRNNAGYGLWQLAHGAKNALTAENYATARATMMALTNDQGQPLGVKPTHLVVGATGEAAGRAIVEAQQNAAGGSNVWYKTAELVVCPWLP